MVEKKLPLQLVCTASEARRPRSVLVDASALACANQVAAFRPGKPLLWQQAGITCQVVDSSSDHLRLCPLVELKPLTQRALEQLLLSLEPGTRCTPRPAAGDGPRTPSSRTAWVWRCWNFVGDGHSRGALAGRIGERFSRSALEWSTYWGLFFAIFLNTKSRIHIQRSSPALSA